MLRFLRYCFSHCLHAAMTRLEEVNGEVSVWWSVRWLGYLSGLNLLVAICLGLYVRWVHAEESVLIVICVLALLVLGVASVLYYFYSLERVSSFLLHLCYGFLLGLLCFLNPPAQERDVRERAVSYLLLVSVALRTLWALLERLLGLTRYRPAFLTLAERSELAGFAAAGVALRVQQSPSVAVLLVALAAVMIALRVKVLLALLNLVCFASVTGAQFVKSLDVRTNPFALACFFSLLICDPLLDFFFSGLTLTERWQALLRSRALWRRLSLLPLLLLEGVFTVLAAQKFSEPDSGYLVVLGFVLLVVFWVVFHMVFFLTVWGFHTKLSDCQRLYPSHGLEDTSLDKVMASKGMRHFCLLSERLVALALVSTVAVAALCWQVSSTRRWSEAVHKTRHGLHYITYLLQLVIFQIPGFLQTLKKS